MHDLKYKLPSGLSYSKILTCLLAMSVASSTIGTTGETTQKRLPESNDIIIISTFWPSGRLSSRVHLRNGVGTPVAVHLNSKSSPRLGLPFSGSILNCAGSALSNKISLYMNEWKDKWKNLFTGFHQWLHHLSSYCIVTVRYWAVKSFWPNWILIITHQWETFPNKNFNTYTLPAICYTSHGHW